MKIILLFMLVISIFSCNKMNKHIVVVMETNFGIIELTLDAAKAPITVKNFLSYVEESFYDDTIFHRVIPRFMIQGGGFNAYSQVKKTNAPIKNESGNGLTNKRGSIAMARTNDLNSATSQFYINHRNNFQLDEMKYAVFGEVTSGMDVVDKIANGETRNMGGSFQNIPVKTVIIESVRIKE